jgi:hypothetical protein
METSMRLGFVISVVFAAAYAVFEVFGRPCKIFPCRRLILGLGLYNLLIMMPLFIAISLVSVKAEGKRIGAPSSLLIAGSIFLFMIVLEDIVFFVVARSAITPGIFTTQWGYVDTRVTVIPIWYFLAAGCAMLLLGLAMVAEQKNT